MSKIVLALVVTSVGLGALSVHLVRQMKAGEAKVAELQAQVATLEKQRAQFQPQSSPSVAAASGGVPNPFAVLSTNPAPSSKSVTFQSSAPTGAANVAPPRLPSH